MIKIWYYIDMEIKGEIKDKEKGWSGQPYTCYKQMVVILNDSFIEVDADNVYLPYSLIFASFDSAKMMTYPPRSTIFTSI